ncbi:unnamed protein product [marine sediment metagenome]|uniref:Uncharacterized protein n=1 Tax=marine sediment metagenome TaxID=412755 RepID=X1EX73_9ZZZZ
MTRKPYTPNLGKYEQPNKSVCVRLTPDSYAVFEEMAKANRWSVAAAVRYCAEGFLEIRPKTVIMPKGRSLG